MTNQIRHTERDKTPVSRRDERLSPDGLWRSYPNQKNLLRYVKSGTYYGRIKVAGKLIRRSLQRDGEGEISFRTATDRLRDFIKKELKSRHVVGTFADARLLYESELGADHAMTEGSKDYRRYCIRILLKSWPELDGTKLEKVTAADCKAWAAKLSAQIHQTYFNNVLGTLRAILKRGGLFENPAMEIKRLGVNKTVLQLPEPEQFNQLLEIMQTAGAGESKNCANFVRFLAFSGCRISEAKQVRWSNVDFQRGLIHVMNAKQRLAKNGDDSRQVPIIPDMLALLT